jgi:DNA polymerase I-like protein with 3'-5' exonuclease and polymerase domains
MPRRRIGLPQRDTAPAAPIEVPKSLQKKAKPVKDMEAVIAQAKAMSEKYAGQYEYIVDKDKLIYYIDKIIDNRRAGVDTETTGLDIFHDECVGFSLSTASEKAVYIPMKHLSRFTGQVDTNQLPVEFCAQQLARLKDIKDLELNYFNAQFDLNIFFYSMGVDLRDIRTNDAFLMMRMLNTERHRNNNLKDLHADFCSHTTRGPRFGELFPPGTFNRCPYMYSAAYAARDAEMADELVEYGYTQLRKPENAGLLRVYEDIERPLIPVLLRMRERGVLVDEAKRADLTVKYRAIQAEAEQEVIHEYEPYIPKINQWRMRFGRAKGKTIDMPVKIGSESQLKILLFDIMGLPRPESGKVDKEALKGLNVPIANAVLKYREASKLLSTYLEGLDKFIQKDGCVHGGIKQLGADTGRTSAYDPNMQNIPSHNREIRTMYIARPGRYLISCDYSGQEPRLTASLSKDPKMIETYQKGQDLYSMIAAVAFNTTYEECLEKRPNGELYLEGKERRGQAKTIVLGICYGRQIPSIAEQLKCSVDEAQLIYDKVTKSFPGLLKAQDESAQMAHDKGYVETLWGRRRHLSVMMHDPYEFRYKDGCNPDFDPFDLDGSNNTNEVSEANKKKYTKDLMGFKWRKDKTEYINGLIAQGIEVTDYSYQISEQSRKCLNARIQGSAADMSKLAMIAIDNDERLKKLNCYLLLMIHDEVICECPIENHKEAIQYIKEDMEKVASHLPVPFKSDPETAVCWYGAEVDIEDEEEEEA